MKASAERLTRPVDYTEICRCGHPRYEHHRAFGCMRWDERKAGCWCLCDGFARRERPDDYGRH